ncbi:hypothetical protein MCERE10_03643 [Burkholderiaceae bacterium]
MNKHVFSHLEHKPATTVGVAQPMQSIVAPRIKTFETQKAANDDLVELSFRKLTNLAEKKKWERCFAKAYAGQSRPLTAEMFNVAGVIYVVASANGQDCGHVRLIKKHITSTHDHGSVWSLDTAFVEERFRHYGVFKELIVHAVNVYGIKLIHIDADRYWKHQYYYEGLGFQKFVFVDDTPLGYAVHNSFNKQSMVPRPKAPYWAFHGMS